MKAFERKIHRNSPVENPREKAEEAYIENTSTHRDRYKVVMQLVYTPRERQFYSINAKKASSVLHEAKDKAAIQRTHGLF